MNRQRIYKAYGLIFSSEMEIPELQRAEGKPDVEVCLGKVPQAMKRSLDATDFFHASELEFLLKIEDVAAFYVVKGKRIIIQPSEGSSELDIRVFLLGSVFGALLQQRGYLVLHGASLNINGQGVLLTGEAGIGKSTLASAFHKKGYSILTDDVCAVKVEEGGNPSIIPGFPSLKLWKDAAERMGRTVDGLIPVRKSIDKFRVDIDEQFCRDSVPLCRVYVLLNSDTDQAELAVLTNVDKLKALMKNSYRYNYLRDQGLGGVHFQQCVAVANHISVFCIYRNKEMISPEAVADLVEAQIMIQ